MIRVVLAVLFIMIPAEASASIRIRLHLPLCYGYLGQPYEHLTTQTWVMMPARPFIVVDTWASNDLTFVNQVDQTWQIAPRLHAWQRLEGQRWTKFREKR